MRSLLAFQGTKRPCVALVFYTRGSTTPAFILASRQIKDFSSFNGSTLLVGVTAVNTYAVIDSAKYSEEKPNSGGGLNDASISISVINGDAYTQGAWSRLIYSAGVTVDDFYIKAYACDGDKLNFDVGIHSFLGIFSFDSELSWDEQSTTTNFRLRTILKTMDEKVVDIPDAVAQQLQASDWSGLKDLPLHIGNFNKVRATGMLRLYGSGISSISRAKIKFIKSGFIKETWTSGALKLGGVTGDAFFAANVGNGVRIIHQSGEALFGTLVSLGADGYGLTGVTRDQPLTSFTHVSCKILNTWIGFDSYNSYSTIYLDRLFAAPAEALLGNGYVVYEKNSKTCWWQVNNANQHLSVGRTVAPTGVYAIGLAVPPINRQALPINQFLDGSAFPSFDGIIRGPGVGSTEIGTGTPRPGSFTLKDPAAPLSSINGGDSWTIIINDYLNAALSYDVNQGRTYYLMSVGTTVKSGRVYASVDGQYVAIPPSNYTISYNQTYLGVTNLTKIVLNDELHNIFPTVSEDPNTGQEIYRNIDYSHIAVDIEKARKFPWAIKTLLNLNSFYTSLLHTSIQTPPTENTANIDAEWGPFLSLKITDETYTQILDTVCFESGISLVPKSGAIGYRRRIRAGHKQLLWQSGPNLFCKESFIYDSGENRVISKAETLLKSPTINVGKVLSYKNSYGQEYIKVNGTFRIRVEELTNTVAELRNKNGRGKRDRDFEYDFKCINEQKSAEIAATNIACIGSSSGLSETNRQYGVTGVYDLLRFECADGAHLVDFPFVSDADTITALTPKNIIKDTDDVLYHQYLPAEADRVVLPNIVVVERMEVDFDKTASPVSLTLRQSAIYANISLRYGQDVSNFPNPGVTTGTPTTPVPNIPNGACTYSGGSTDGNTAVSTNNVSYNSCGGCGGNAGSPPLAANVPNPDILTAPCPEPSTCNDGFSMQADTPNNSCNCTNTYTPSATCQIKDATTPATNSVNAEATTGLFGSTCCSQVIGAVLSSSYLTTNNFNPAHVSVSSIDSDPKCGATVLGAGGAIPNILTVSAGFQMFTATSPTTAVIPITVYYTDVIQQYLDWLVANPTANPLSAPTSVLDSFTTTVKICLADLPTLIPS